VLGGQQFLVGALANRIEKCIFYTLEGVADHGAT